MVNRVPVNWGHSSENSSPQFSSKFKWQNKETLSQTTSSSLIIMALAAIPNGAVTQTDEP
jgi:hypothetical protein